MRRERLNVVLVLLALGGATVLSTTQTFATLRLTGTRTPLVVAGSTVVPALAPLGIVLLALAAALTIAGRIARTVLGVLLVLLGAAIAALALPSLADPAAGTTGAVRTATGVTDVSRLLDGVTGSPWPAVAFAAGALAALLGLAVVARGRRWPVGGARYRAGEEAVVSSDPVDEWDALTRGTDPTD